ncbi:alginate export family protein [Croceitalea rosinachiae]|uniref:Alginate export family protein n=1 Tax=Croceitalea rosinachiae TaxID=3075596 RepID=A0ABU3AF54_9FLAO|nr:alginate export family protein [Croceitalea sp. F388]MDT0607723.1 alginate export family protein [Croceitalea sp. F388]
MKQSKLCLKWLIFLNLLSVSLFAVAQEKTEKQEPPALKTNRAQEDYTYLKDLEKNPYKKGFADDLKYIALNSNRSIYLSIGGQYRPRIEHFTNEDYTSNDETFYSQRLALHTSLNLGEYFRVFGELYHGYTSSGEQFPESDVIDLHQAFIEFQILKGENENSSISFGRQELVLGASRLVGNREGPNMRRSFDLAKVIYGYSQFKVKVFYGKEVSPQFEAFDNEFSLFDKDATNPQLWGFGMQFPVYNLNGDYELYYLGFKSKTAGFSDVFGEEKRHSIGFRSYGAIGKRLSYNTEFIYQFGDLDGSTISAFNLETDWKYKLINMVWKPTLGLKLDWSTGDREIGDGKLNTFNPLFVNPALYSLAGVNTPANLTSFHPSLTVFPFDQFSIFVDYALFYRTQSADGLYTPPRFQNRQANGIEENHIGDALGIQLNYEFNRNISFDLRSTYFIAGKFIKSSGESENTFYIAPTLSFKF